MTNPPPAPMAEADYEAILSAVLETARGRGFLAEYMRRNRQADTKLDLEAIEKLARNLDERQNAVGADQMRLDLVDMATAIDRTKDEIASIKLAGRVPGKIGSASDELDAIVATTEMATSEILAAVERVQEIAWALREQGTDAAVCDRLDAQATHAFTACSFQDLTGQRVRRVIEVMHFLEARIDAMIRIWRPSGHGPEAAAAVGEEALLGGPARPGEGLGQSEIDDLIAIDRSDDIDWREVASVPGEEMAPDDADLSRGGRVIVPASPPTPSVSPGGTSAKAAPTPAPLPLKLPARPREAIEALSPAERMALFS